MTATDKGIDFSSVIPKADPVEQGIDFSSVIPQEPQANTDNGIDFSSVIPKEKPVNKYGLRLDGTAKGDGFFGALPMQDGSGNVASEISVGVGTDKWSADIPTLVPTLSEDEKTYLLKGGDPRQNKSIMQKAIKHAQGRFDMGKSQYADDKESQKTVADLQINKESAQPQMKSTGEIADEKAKNWQTYVDERTGTKPVTFADKTGKETPFKITDEASNPDQSFWNKIAVRAGRSPLSFAEPIIDMVGRYTNDPRLKSLYERSSQMSSAEQQANPAEGNTWYQKGALGVADMWAPLLATVATSLIPGLGEATFGGKLAPYMLEGKKVVPLATKLATTAGLTIWGLNGAAEIGKKLRDNGITDERIIAPLSILGGAGVGAIMHWNLSGMLFKPKPVNVDTLMNAVNGFIWNYDKTAIQGSLMMGEQTAITGFMEQLGTALDKDLKGDEFWKHVDVKKLVMDSGKAVIDALPTMMALGVGGLAHTKFTSEHATPQQKAEFKKAMGEQMQGKDLSALLPPIEVAKKEGTVSEVAQETPAPQPQMIPASELTPESKLHIADDGTVMSEDASGARTPVQMAYSKPLDTLAIALNNAGVPIDKDGNHSLADVKALHDNIVAKWADLGQTGIPDTNTVEKFITDNSQNLWFAKENGQKLTEVLTAIRKNRITPEAIKDMYERKTVEKSDALTAKSDEQLTAMRNELIDNQTKANAKGQPVPASEAKQLNDINNLLNVRKNIPQAELPLQDEAVKGKITASEAKPKMEQPEIPANKYEARKLPIVEPSKTSTIIEPKEAVKLIQSIRAGDERSKRKGEVFKNADTEKNVGTLEKRVINLSDFSEETLDYLRQSTDADRVEKYARQKIDTPVYLKINAKGNLIISDGGHRILAAIGRGDKTINALVTVEKTIVKDGLPVGEEVSKLPFPKVKKVIAEGELPTGKEATRLPFPKPINKPIFDGIKYPDNRKASDIVPAMKDAQKPAQGELPAGEEAKALPIVPKEETQPELPKTPKPKFNIGKQTKAISDEIDNSTLYGYLKRKRSDTDAILDKVKAGIDVKKITEEHNIDTEIIPAFKDGKIADETMHLEDFLQQALEERENKTQTMRDMQSANKRENERYAEMEKDINDKRQSDIKTFSEVAKITDEKAKEIADLDENNPDMGIASVLAENAKDMPSDSNLFAFYMDDVKKAVENGNTYKGQATEIFKQAQKDNADINFSKNNSKGEGRIDNAPETVTSIYDRIKKVLPFMPELVSLKDELDPAFPADARRAFAKEIGGDSAHAFYYNGKIYSFSDNFSAKDTVKRLLHEGIGHAGILKAFPELVPVLENLYKTNEAFRKLVDVTGESNRAVALQEGFAKYAESGLLKEGHPLIRKIQGLIAKMLEKMGLGEYAKSFNETDIMDMIAKSVTALGGDTKTYEKEINRVKVSAEFDRVMNGEKNKDGVKEVFKGNTPAESRVADIVNGELTDKLDAMPDASAQEKHEEYAKSREWLDRLFGEVKASEKDPSRPNIVQGVIEPIANEKNAIRKEGVRTLNWLKPLQDKLAPFTTVGKQEYEVKSDEALFAQMNELVKNVGMDKAIQLAIAKDSGVSEDVRIGILANAVNQYYDMAGALRKNGKVADADKNAFDAYSNEALRITLEAQGQGTDYGRAIRFMGQLQAIMTNPIAVEANINHQNRVVKENFVKKHEDVLAPVIKEVISDQKTSAVDRAMDDMMRAVRGDAGLLFSKAKKANEPEFSFAKDVFNLEQQVDNSKKEKTFEELETERINKAYKKATELSPELPFDKTPEGKKIIAEVMADAKNNPKKYADKLTKHKGSTLDSRGTEFDYVAYAVKDSLGEVKEITYADDMGFGLEAKSLDELKQKIGAYEGKSGKKGQGMLFSKQSDNEAKVAERARELILSPNLQDARNAGSILANEFQGKGVQPVRIKQILFETLTAIAGERKVDTKPILQKNNLDASQVRDAIAKSNKPSPVDPQQEFDFGKDFIERVTAKINFRNRDIKTRKQLKNAIIAVGDAHVKGIISSDQIAEIFMDKMNIGRIDDKAKKELIGLADDLSKFEPNTAEYKNFQQDLMQSMQQVINDKISLDDQVTSLFYSFMLSRLSTQGTNLGGTSILAVPETLLELIDINPLNQGKSLRNLQSLWMVPEEGFAKGLSEGLHHIKTGKNIIREIEKKVEAPNVGRGLFKGKASFLNNNVYVQRAMMSADTLIFKPLQGVKARTVAVGLADKALKEGKITKDKYWDYVKEVLYLTDNQKQSATEQATREFDRAKEVLLKKRDNLTGKVTGVVVSETSKEGMDIRRTWIKRRTWEIGESNRNTTPTDHGTIGDRSKEFGLDGTLNGEGTGIITTSGILAGKLSSWKVPKDMPMSAQVPMLAGKMTLKNIITFTRILANIAEYGLDVGAGRGFLTMAVPYSIPSVVGFDSKPKLISWDRRVQRLKRSMAGVAGMTALGILAMAGKKDEGEDFEGWFDVYGSMVDDPVRRKKMATIGAYPFSIRFGKRIIPFSNIIPLAAPLAVIGGIRDRQRAGKWKDTDWMDKALVPMIEIGRVTMNTGFIKGMNGFVDMFNQNMGTDTTKDKLESFAIRSAGNIVPGIAKEVSGWFMENKVDNKDTTAKILSQIPFFQGFARSSVGYFGSPVKNHPFGYLSVNAEGSDYEYFKLLSEKNVKLGKPGAPEVNGAILKGEDAYNYTINAGKYTKQMIDAVGFDTIRNFKNDKWSANKNEIMYNEDGEISPESKTTTRANLLVGHMITLARNQGQYEFGEKVPDGEIWMTKEQFQTFIGKYAESAKKILPEYEKRIQTYNDAHKDKPVSSEDEKKTFQKYLLKIKSDAMNEMWKKGMDADERSASKQRQKDYYEKEKAEKLSAKNR